VNADHALDDRKESVAHLTLMAQDVAGRSIDEGRSTQHLHQGILVEVFQLWSVPGESGCLKEPEMNLTFGTLGSRNIRVSLSGF